jgi:hypothetical protein
MQDALDITAAFPSFSLGQPVGESIISNRVHEVSFWPVAATGKVCFSASIGGSAGIRDGRHIPTRAVMPSVFVSARMIAPTKGDM